MSKKLSVEVTRGNLINAAGELAVEFGIDNVSTRLVAELARENIGSIHYHFGGKGGLFMAVVQKAIDGCVKLYDESLMSDLGESPTREELSEALRCVISADIAGLFRSDHPSWYAQLIYQLLQRDDELYQLFQDKHLDPNWDYMARLLRFVKPGLDDEQVFILTSLIKMPIFAHASYKRALLRRLKAKKYSESYLLKLEDLLVRQAQLLLDLPVGEPVY